jgi:hypothetical protein
LTVAARPDPATELRITALHGTRGINFWSKRPVIRMDVAVGSYDDISSAEVEGFTEALVSAMPGLLEHRCSLGTRGGFVTRLRRGTYPPHVIEHVALELQTMIGHDVGYGRTRGGDVPGEYTLVFEHRHEQVGLRAAALALEIVQRALAGTLESVQAAAQELAALADTENTPPLIQRVFCGVSGGSARAEAQQELARAFGPDEERLVVDVSPAYLLQAGLPYSRSDFGIVLDTRLSDVPDRYRDVERARRLMAIIADGVKRDGFLICPAKEWEVQDYAREQDCRVGVFAVEDNVTRRDERVAAAVAYVESGRIRLENCGAPADGGELRPDYPASAQVAAALLRYIADGSCR